VHTVHTIDSLVERERRRSNKTSTNAVIARKAFGDEIRKKLPIPTFIDDYNYHMGGVDLANQYRAAYETHKNVFRSWFCIFTALLDIVIVNCYRLSYVAAMQRNIPPNRLSKQATFRETLFQQLFAFSSHSTIQRRRYMQRHPPPIRNRAVGLHEWGNRATQQCCMQCRIEIAAAKKLRSQGLSVTNPPHTDSAGRATKSSRGCIQCDVPLCIRRGCWERFHAKK